MTSSLRKYSQEFFSRKRNDNNLLSMGNIFEIIDEKDKQKKIIQIFRMTQDVEESKNFLQTVSILKLMNHDNIINIKQNLVAQKHVFLEFDFVEYDLQTVLQKKSTFMSSKHIKYIFYQIVLGVSYLHGHNIEHLNLSQKNILLNGQCDVKIGGFDKAKPTFLRKRDSMKSIYQHYYTAPEIILNNGDNHQTFFKADIWALGCIFFELLEKKSVFDVQRQYLDLIKWMCKLLGKPTTNEAEFIQNDSAKDWVNKLPSFPKRTPSSYLNKDNDDSDAKDLLDMMFKFDPRERPLTEEILQHKYFKEIFYAKDLRYVKSFVPARAFQYCDASSTNISKIHKALQINLES